MQMTYEDICRVLTDAGVEEAPHEAALLLTHFCGVTQAELPLVRGRNFDDAALRVAVGRRCAREPLQYILGTWYFCHEVYEVNAHTLIPRSDTELLVELAVRHLREGAHFADFCTGSGCVAVSTLCARPDTTALAVDKFPETLAVAERNAVRNGVAARMRFDCRDVLAVDGALYDPQISGSFDAILANPPYIASSVVPALSPEVRHEPQAALDGGADGLCFYRAILAGASRLLRPGGLLLFEIGYDQRQAVLALGEERGYRGQCLRDLGGQDRVVLFTRADAKE